MEKENGKGESQETVIYNNNSNKNVLIALNLVESAVFRTTFALPQTTEDQDLIGVVVGQQYIQ